MFGVLFWTAPLDFKWGQAWLAGQTFMKTLGMLTGAALAAKECSFRGPPTLLSLRFPSKPL